MTKKALIVAAWMLLGVAPARAATRTVINTNDSGDGSLRWAVEGAGTGDNVVIDIGFGIINVGTPLTFRRSITVSAGLSKVFIDGGNSVPVFIVNAGLNVAISGVTIRHGSSLLGGGVFNAGTLALTDVIVSDCTMGTQLGGGIFNSGTLTLTRCLVSGNAVSRSGSGEEGDGGGLYNIDGSVEVIDSEFTGNNAPTGFGGAIENLTGTVTITDSSFNANTALAGGAIATASGKLVVNGSTFSSNVATNDGGGILNATLEIESPPPGQASVTNSTFVGNGAAIGAAISNDQGETSVANCTIAGNAASQREGFAISSVLSNQPPFGLFVKGTLLANNTGGNCFPVDTTSLGYNLSDDTTCDTIFTATGDRNNVAAGLDSGGLLPHGGPTATVALLATSPAVNAIPTAACTDRNGTPISRDQRGVTRPQGSACDIGAFELFASRFLPQAVAVYRIVDAVAALNLPGTVQQQLTDPLQATILALNAGRTKTASNTLTAFINQANSRVKDGSLTQAQATPLTVAAQAVIQSL
jgi:hypothetical protein